MRSFKKTLAKLLAFIACVLLITELVTEPYFQNEVFQYQDSAVRDTYAGQLDALICGSSHAYRAIMPAVLDETLGTSSYNLSNSMITMQGRYELLRQEIARNPVNFVILDATYNSMTRSRAAEGPEGDIYQLGRYRNFFTRAGYFFKTIRLDEYGRVYYDMLSRGVTSWRKLLDGKGARGTSVKYETRGFVPMEEAVPRPVTPPEEYGSYPLQTALDPGCVYYMGKILELCQQQGIQVLVVVTPISQAELLKFDGIDTVYTNLMTYFADRGVTMLDFNLYQGKQTLFPDETAYSDDTHMSPAGAADFSALLAKTIAQWRAGQDVTGDFYPSYAAAQAA